MRSRKASSPGKPPLGFAGRLGKGSLQGCILTCPWHGWQFDVRNGEFQLHKSIVQPKFEVRVEEGAVQVRIPESPEQT